MRQGLNGSVLWYFWAKHQQENTHGNTPESVNDYWGKFKDVLITPDTQEFDTQWQLL